MGKGKHPNQRGEFTAARREQGGSEAVGRLARGGETTGSVELKIENGEGREREGRERGEQRTATSLRAYEETRGLDDLGLIGPGSGTTWIRKGLNNSTQAQAQGHNRLEFRVRTHIKTI